MKKKMIIKLSILLSMIILCSCTKKEESMFPNANNIKETQINKAKSYKVSEDITIDKKYLEKKYPGKTVLTWVYTESENMSKKERKEFNEPLGIKYMTNNQVIKLNNYLVSKGKDYVICFRKIGTGKNYAGDIEKLDKEGEGPDFIYARWYLDEKSKTYTSNLTYDLIGKDMFEELSQYRKSDLKNYFSTLSENAIKLSSVNGNYYGYNKGISSLVINQGWYVNSDLAKKYDVDLNKFESGGYDLWLDACNKVYKGEKQKGSTNFLLCEGGGLKPINESSIVGYINQMDKNGSANISAFGISIDGKQIENYYKSLDVKKSLKEIVSYVKKGYFEYLNEDETNNTVNANVFISNIYYETVKGKDGEANWEAFPKVKNMEQYKWGDYSVNPQDLIDYNSINGIYKKSVNKKIALAAYDFINSDVEASNIIKFPEYDGSGKDYNITEAEYIEFYDKDENKGKVGQGGNCFVNPFVANPFAGDNSIEKMKKNIENLKFNKKFVDRYYDFNPVKKEVKKIKSLEKKYLGNSFNYEGSDYKGKIFTGDFEKEYNNFLKELDKAGIERVLEYLNNN